MKFKLNDGQMCLVRKDVLTEMREAFPVSTTYLVDMPKIKHSIKNMDFLKGKTFTFVPMVALGVATGGSGVFWDTFMHYIFPWMMDIAKVFCVIKIAQGFYQEKRGGRDDGSGFGTFVTYGKWYLLFMLIPWGVELIDQLGGKMLTDLQSNPLQ